MGRRLQCSGRAGQGNLQIIGFRLLFWIAPKFLMIFYEIIEILFQTSQFFHPSRSPLSFLSFVLWKGGSLFVVATPVENRWW